MIRNLFFSVFFLLVTSTSALAVTFTLNGTTWTPSQPSSTINASDSVILINGATWNVPGAGFFGISNVQNYGVIVINVGTTLNTDFLTNYGTILLYGELDLFGTLNNQGTLNGTGLLSSAVGGFLQISPINNNNGGSVNGCTQPTGCVSNTNPSNIGLPPSNGGSNITYSVSGSTLQATSCLDNVAFTVDYTINVASGNVRSIGNMAVQSGVTLTINSAVSLEICGKINNDGTIIINSGGALTQLGVSNENLGSGTYIVRQTGGQTSDQQYNIWSSPISSALILDANGGTGIETFPNTNPCDLYVVDGSTQEWKYDFNPSLTYTCLSNPSVSFSGFTSNDAVSDGIMDVGRGYFAVGNNSPKEFVGTINNAGVSIPVFANNLPVPSGWAQQNLNLIGNPYPSGLDATEFFTDNSAVLTDAIYFWDDNTDSYVAWNVSGGSAPANPNIGVGQGFWVIATSNSSVSFSNSQRSSVNNQFFKTENTANSNVWLELSTPNGSKGNILVGYSKEATDGMDRLYDAHFMPGNDNVKLVSVINGEEFMIQSVGNLNFQEEKVIALNVRTSETGIHTFSELKRDYIPNSVNVFLRDLETGTMHDLSKGDLSIRLKAEVDYNGRFEMVFINTALENADDAISGVGGDAVTGVENIVSDSEYKLLNEANGYSLYNADGINGTIRVMDVTGKVIYTQSNISNTPTVRLDLNGVSGGVYIVEIIENGSRVYTTKLIK